MPDEPEIIHLISINFDGKLARVLLDALGPLAASGELNEEDFRHIVSSAIRVEVKE